MGFDGSRETRASVYGTEGTAALRGKGNAGPKASESRTEHRQLRGRSGCQLRRSQQERVDRTIRDSAAIADKDYPPLVLLGLFRNRLTIRPVANSRGRMEKSKFTRDYQILTQLLRAIRQEAGTTQVELAERLGETQSYVSKVERGERRLDMVQLRWFCGALGVPLKTFADRYEKQL